jgi:hypothetical protein
MNTAPFIARLRAQCPGFKYIGGALDLNETTLQSANQPSAYVLPLSETAEPGRLLGVHDQRITQTWGVVLVLRAARTTAQDQSAELDTLRQSVRTALAGWTPDAASTEPLDIASGQLVSLEAGLLLWQDEFTTQTHHRSPA